MTAAAAESGLPVAVVGCGLVSIVHLEAIAANPNARLVAVCDTDSGRRSTAAAQYGVPGFANHRELIEAGIARVVHVCTPHDQHVGPTVDLLTAGVPVIMEKPLAHRLADGEQIVRAAEATGTKIAVCFQNRYNHTSQAIRDLLESGRLGAVLGGSGAVLWHRPEAYYRLRPWRAAWASSGGGTMINQAIHTLDLLQWLLGDVVASAGSVSRRVPIAGVEVEDTADLVLDHASGARSVLFASNANVVDAPITLEIATERANLFVRGDLTISWADGRIEVVPERRAASGGRAYWGVSHALLIDDFYRRLADPEPFWISPAEAAKTLRILDQLYAGADLRTTG